jgi:hypothetical protein
MTTKYILSMFIAGGCLMMSAAEPAMTVYKTKTCGCCGKWIEHLRANGFTVNVKEVDATEEARKQFGVPDQLASCHTGVVGGYAVEGHVPAADVRRLLKEKPKAKGISVPGMPLGSPGMEQGPRKDPYSVLLFDEKGGVKEYQKYPRP